MITPSLELRIWFMTRAVGTAKPRAQGQATIRTDMVFIMAVSIFPEIKYQAVNVAMANVNTTAIAVMLEKEKDCVLRLSHHSSFHTRSPRKTVESSVEEY